MSLLTWNIPAANSVTIVTNPATEWLAAMSTCIDANSGSGAAYWEKAGYSAASPRYLILKRKSGAAGRLIFFGQTGSSADADAVSGTPTGGELWVSYSHTSTSNTPDQSWLTVGKPLTASDSTRGIGCFLMQTSTTPYRINYAEHADGFLWLIGNTTLGMALAGGGGLMQDTAGNTINVATGTGGDWVTNGVWVSGGGTQSWLSAYIEDEAAVNPSYAKCFALINGRSETVYRALSMPIESADRLHDRSNAELQFFPIPMVYHNSDTAKNVAGQMRQIAMGPQCHRETRFYSAGPTFLAYGHAPYTYYSSINPGVWFTGIAV